MKEKKETLKSKKILIFLINLIMSTNITAKQVNELRQKTGSGMMDCKKAFS